MRIEDTNRTKMIRTTSQIHVLMFLECVGSDWVGWDPRSSRMDGSPIPVTMAKGKWKGCLDWQDVAQRAGNYLRET